MRNQLLGDLDLAIEKYPQFIEATVALDRAERDLANTVLRAPIAGIATQVTSIQMGRYLTAGMAVFSIIGTDNVWIDANPKETDLTHVRPGQPVTITVDAFPVARVAGHGSPPSAPAPARSSPSSRRRTPPATGSRSCSACRAHRVRRRARTCAGCAPA